MNCGRPQSARKRLKKIAPTEMNRMVEVLLSDSHTEARTSWSEKVPLAMAITKAKAAPRAAASVVVATPV